MPKCAGAISSRSLALEKFNAFLMCSGPPDLPQGNSLFHLTHPLGPCPFPAVGPDEPNMDREHCAPPIPTFELLHSKKLIGAFTGHNITLLGALKKNLYALNAIKWSICENIEEPLEFATAFPLWYTYSTCLLLWNSAM